MACILARVSNIFYPYMCTLARFLLLHHQTVLGPRHACCSETTKML